MVIGQHATPRRSRTMYGKVTEKGHEEVLLLPVSAPV